MSQTVGTNRSGSLVLIHEDYPNVTLLRENDQFLMQAFVSNGFRGQELS